MPSYLYVYIGGEPSTQADAQRDRDHWKGWFAKLGDVVIEEGEPTREAAVLLKADGTAATTQLQVSGYSIIAAADYQQAIDLARTCPVFSVGGHVCIAKIIGPE